MNNFIKLILTSLIVCNQSNAAASEATEPFFSGAKVSNITLSDGKQLLSIDIEEGLNRISFGFAPDGSLQLDTARVRVVGSDKHICDETIDNRLETGDGVINVASGKMLTDKFTSDQGTFIMSGHGLFYSTLYTLETTSFIWNQGKNLTLNTSRKSPIESIKICGRHKGSDGKFRALVHGIIDNTTNMPSKTLKPLRNPVYDGGKGLTVYGASKVLILYNPDADIE
tara:strand:- start:2246 stop:2923 length:678 start_codon:yes stop_codon:yes gene_type:complete